MSKKNKNTTPATQNANVEGLMTLNEVAIKYEISPIYVRNALRAGALQGIKVPLAEGSKTVKWLISEEQYNEWRDARKSRSRRADGRNKFVLYATQDEKAKLEALLAENGIEATIEKAWTKKVEAELEAAVVTE